MDDREYLTHPRPGATPPPEPEKPREAGLRVEWFFRNSPELLAGMSLRHGGVSAPPYASLNLGGNTGDDPKAVTENRARFYAAAGIHPGRGARMAQVHGARVVTVDEPGPVGEADGLVTARTDLALLVTVADCLPIFVADLSAGVIGALHAGWRGVVAGIIEGGLAALVGAGARPEHMRVVIGPGIGPCCFEVGPEVAARFDPRTLRPGRRERPHLDLVHATRLKLEAGGIAPPAITDPESCTLCRRDRYFSARSGEPTGRMVGFILRRPAASR